MTFAIFRFPVTSHQSLVTKHLHIVKFFSLSFFFKGFMLK